MKKGTWIDGKRVYIPSMHASLRSWLLWSLPIILAALAVYLWPALHADFVSVDDGLLITKNMAVHELTLASLTYNFTHYDPELYIPLTFLSYRLEYLFLACSRGSII